ncbi:MAG: T9SS type A sorting domain-containing protein [Chitinophagales bacterium]
MQKVAIFLLTLLIHVSFLTKANEGYLGISIKPYELDLKQGLRIINVFDDGAALVSGIKENDFIFQVNGYNVTSPTELKNIIQQFQWGDEVVLTYIRDGVLSTKVVVLGHQKKVKTYEILKTDKLGNIENWYFKDNTTIVFEEGKPVSITKKIDGVKETLELANYQDYERLPQKFLDLSDKLFIIEKTKEDQLSRNSSANSIVVIKEIVSVETPTNIIESISYDEFKVFPNPNNGVFDVRLKANDLDDKLMWTVYDLQGRNILNGVEENNNGTFEKHITLDNIASGTYLFYIKSGNQRISQQFIVE